MDAPTALGWALLVSGALILLAVVLVAVVVRRSTRPDPVDAHYRTAQAALWLTPDHRSPEPGCDSGPCRMERATARTAARMVADAERYLRRQARR